MRSEPVPRLLLPLTQRNFKLYYGASVLSMVGSQLTLIAFPWFVLKVTGDPAAMGLVLAVEGIPRAAFMILAARSPTGSRHAPCLRCRAFPGLSLIHI